LSALRLGAEQVGRHARELHAARMTGRQGCIVHAGRFLRQTQHTRCTSNLSSGASIRCRGSSTARSTFERHAARSWSMSTFARAASARRRGDPVERVERPADVGECLAKEARIGPIVPLARTQRSADRPALPERDRLEQRGYGPRVRGRAQQPRLQERVERPGHREHSGARRVGGDPHPDRFHRSTPRRLSLSSP
jgi:hypothetical protein